MKKLQELTAAAIEPPESNIYLINPRMSYVPEGWVKTDPSFWAPK